MAERNFDRKFKFLDMKPVVKLRNCAINRDNIDYMALMLNAYFRSILNLEKRRLLSLEYGIFESVFIIARI